MPSGKPEHYDSWRMASTALGKGKEYGQFLGKCEGTTIRIHFLFLISWNTRISTGAKIRMLERTSQPLSQKPEACKSQTPKVIHAGRGPRLAESKGSDIAIK